MLEKFRAVGDALRAIPGPTEHWASILSAWAWPTAILFVVYGLRGPIRLAADKLADRFGRDNIELGNWLKITSEVSLTTLDQHAVTEEPGTAEAIDVKIVEALLEFVGESDENAGRLLRWISQNGGPTLDAEEFLIADRFVNLRAKAYGDLIEEQANG